MREEFNGFFIIKQAFQDCTPFCSVVKRSGSGYRTQGETLNYVSCFPYDFFRALAAS